VTRVFEQRLVVVRRERIAKVHGRSQVFGSSTVIDHSITPAPTGNEPLDELHRRRAVAVCGARIEVGRFDDERIAFPVAARLAHVRQLAGARRVVEADDPRLVHHLVANGDEAGRLRDVVGVAVNRRHHRSGKAAGDAAIVEAAIEP
jgi:hypothetical protein